ncbi:MAG: hypothetical protein BWK77_09365 [Verrucomicrobia bacterium A1]|nr:MAG: hypothetical protein BWK77_09365 [Verrucomicrobia bacterium A1]
MKSMRVTDFQQYIYDATRSIPKGRVTTYALLGQAIGCRSPRAVGQALRRNPFAPKVPCHRVIVDRRNRERLRGQQEFWRDRRRHIEPGLRQLRVLDAGEVSAGVRRGDRQRREPVAAGVSPKGPVRRGVLRGPAQRRRA